MDKYINPDAILDHSITIDKIANLTINVTYNELKNRKDARTLVPGAYYRIIDFCTYYKDNYIDSAEHPFDIIVLALDNSHLSEDAYATQHEGDTYFANNNLSAWKLKYCLDNNTDRFDWIDTTIIEKNIEISFWSGRRYARNPEYDDDSFTYGICWVVPDTYIKVFTATEHPIPNVDKATEDSPKDTAERTVVDYKDREYKTKGVIYNMIDEFNNEAPYDFKNIRFYRGYDSAYRMWVTRSSVEYGGIPVFTFSSFGDETTTEFTDLSLNADNYIHNNTIKPRIDNSKQYLNECCFFGTECLGNTLGHNNTGVNFNSKCQYNKLGNVVTHCNFNKECVGNIIEEVSTAISLGELCKFNHFDIRCNSNVLNNNCCHNTFGSFSCNNIMRDNCSYNKFGNNSREITMGNNCTNNIFEEDVHYVKFGNNDAPRDPGNVGNNFSNNVIENGSYYVILYNAEESETPVKNYHIRFNSISAVEFAIINATRGLNYHINVAKNSSGVIKTYCEADLVD